MAGTIDAALGPTIVSFQPHFRPPIRVQKRPLLLLEKTTPSSFAQFFPLPHPTTLHLSRITMSDNELDAELLALAGDDEDVEEGEA